MSNSFEVQMEDAEAEVIRRNNRQRMARATGKKNVDLDCPACKLTVTVGVGAKSPFCYLCDSPLLVKSK